MEPVRAGSIMAPLNRLLEATRRVAEGDLSKRIVTTGSSDNELDQLAGSVNHMAGCVEMTQSAPAARNQVLEQQQVELEKLNSYLLQSNARLQFITRFSRVPSGALSIAGLMPAGSTIYILFTFIYLTALYPSFMIDQE